MNAVLDRLNNEIDNHTRAADLLALETAGRQMTEPEERAWIAHRLEAREAAADAAMFLRVHERDLYERNGPHGFFADLASNSVEARDRLARHWRQAARRVGDRVAEVAVAEFEKGAQLRDLSSDVSGSGGEFVPPDWMIDEFSSVVRPALSPYHEVFTIRPLPGGTDELNIPIFESSAGVTTLPCENVNLQPAIEPPTGSVGSAPVVMFSGSVPVSQQWLDRTPGADAILVAEFAASYAADFQDELNSGSGTGGELLGLLNVSTTAVSPQRPGAVAVTYDADSPTSDTVEQAVANLIAVVGATRLRMPTFLVARPERVAWLLGSLDANGEPLQHPGLGYLNASGAPACGPYGPVCGLPLYADATLPNDLGDGADQDCILAVFPSDILVYEDPAPSLLVFNEGLTAPSLSVTVAYRRYASALTARQPSSIGVLTGTGLIVPDGWGA